MRFVITLTIPLRLILDLRITASRRLRTLDTACRRCKSRVWARFIVAFSRRSSARCSAKVRRFDRSPFLT